MSIEENNTSRDEYIVFMKTHGYGEDLVEAYLKKYDETSNVAERDAFVKNVKEKEEQLSKKGKRKNKAREKEGGSKDGKKQESPDEDPPVVTGESLDNSLESQTHELSHFEHLEESDFMSKFNDPSFRQELIVVLRERRNLIDSMVRSVGLNKAGAVRLENKQEIEGYQSFTNHAPHVVKSIQELRDTPVPDFGVVKGRYEEFIKLMEQSERTIESLKAHIGEETVAVKPTPEAGIEENEGPDEVVESTDADTQDADDENAQVASVVEEGSTDESVDGVTTPAIIDVDAEEIAPQKEDGEPKEETVAGNGETGFALVNVSNEDWKKFVDSGEVSYDVLTSIAERTDQGRQLTERELAIYSEKENQIKERQEQLAVTAELSKSREALLEARKRHEELEDEYNALLNSAYAHSSSGLRGKLGLKPKLPAEVQNMLDEKQREIYEANDVYMKAGLDLAEVKYDEEDDKKEAVLSRYSKLLKEKIAVSTYNERLKIQEEAVSSVYPEGTPAAKFMEKYRSVRLVRMTGMVGVYAIVGAATGGAGAAAIAGGSRLVGMIGGIGGGVVGGMGVKVLMEELYVKKKQNKFGAVKEGLGDDLFKRSFEDSYNELVASGESVERAKRRTKVASVAGAAMGGLVAGSSAADAVGDYLNTADTPLPVQSSGRIPDHDILPPSNESLDPRGILDIDRSADPAPQEGKAGMLIEENPQAIGEQPSHSPEVAGAAGTEGLESADQEVPLGGHTAEYTVKSGDNLWNILEGDVEGREMSEVLKSIPEENRDAALTELFNQVDNNEALRDAIGMSNDRAELINVGEDLNILELEKALAAIANEEGYLDGNVAAEVPEASPEGRADLQEVEPVQELGGEIGYDEGAQSTEITKADMDKELQKIISEVEPNPGIGGLFGFNPDTRGTFAQIQNMKISEIQEIQGSGNTNDLLARRAIVAEGWNSWMQTAYDAMDTIPADSGETFGHYMDRVAEVRLHEQLS